MTTNNKPHFKLQPDYNYAVSDFRDGLVELIGLGVDGRLSHKLSFDDMLSNCVEMAFSKADRNCINSQSMELTLTCHQPFFLRFDIWEPFSLVLGFWRDRKDDEQEFMRVLVGRKMNLNKYNYVASKL